MFSLTTALCALWVLMSKDGADDPTQWLLAKDKLDCATAITVSMANNYNRAIPGYWFALPLDWKPGHDS